MHEPVAVEMPGRYRLRNGSYADITEFSGEFRAGLIVDSLAAHTWHRSGRHAGQPELPAYDAVAFVPVAIQRLMDEVREPKMRHSYNRMHNRHNRGWQ